MHYGACPRGAMIDALRGLSPWSPGRPRRRKENEQWAVAQLLYGYRDAEALAAAGTLKAARPAVAALCEMFPPRPHFHYLVDHF